ncbi:hypothetical protein [Paraburkholderia phenazinium]|uniref:hypothetical protein n=1 Tax=Paraburkholderia phenazinium TaxID=60549 RepID=UPI000B844A2A|nr:hypothetical protein [Paraburkholderia phenazinium]
MKQIDHIDEIIRDSFGLWITGLFDSIRHWNPTFSFDEHKAAFFDVVRQLLDQGKIMFIAPGADCYTSPANPHPRYTIYDRDAQWHEPPDEIVRQLVAQWPRHVSNANDPELTVYFYMIPGVIWVDEDGKLYAS